MITLVALAAVFASAIKPAPVIAFDCQGKPMLFQDSVAPAQHMDDMRIRYFSSDFIHSFVGVDTANVREDFAKSLNMMTPSLREKVVHDGREAERRSKLRADDANVRSVFDEISFKIAPYVSTQTTGVIELYAWGRMDFVPKLGEVEEGQQKSVPQWFFSQMKLERTPVTPQSIHGLQVGFIHTTYFDSEQDLRIKLL